MPETVRSSPIALTVLSMLEVQPLHPYAVQRLIKAWGKDQVINVEQRATLYSVFRRLEAAGLIEVQATGREANYPDRTVYALTDRGRATSRTWLQDMLRTPRNEFPQFPAALSFALMLDPADLAAALEGRRDALAAEIAEIERALADEELRALPRIALIETEYVLAQRRAEHGFVAGLVADLRAGRLTWTREQLIEAARDSDALPPGAGTGREGRDGHA